MVTSDWVSASESAPSSLLMWKGNAGLSASSAESSYGLNSFAAYRMFLLAISISLGLKSLM
jgi:hypothetical protein